MSRSVHAYLTVREVLRSPLFWVVTLTGATWVLIRLATIHNFDGHIDPITLAMISVGYTINATVQFLRTGRGLWSILGAGLLATFVGDALFYYYLLARNQHLLVPNPDAYLDLVRALFVVGVSFTLIGHVQEWWLDDGATVRALKRYAGRKDLI